MVGLCTQAVREAEERKLVAVGTNHRPWPGCGMEARTLGIGADAGESARGAASASHPPCGGCRGLARSSQDWLEEGPERIGDVGPATHRPGEGGHRVEPQNLGWAVEPGRSWGAAPASHPGSGWGQSQVLCVVGTGVASN